LGVLVLGACCHAWGRPVGWGTRAGDGRWLGDDGAPAEKASFCFVIGPSSFRFSCFMTQLILRRAHGPGHPPADGAVTMPVWAAWWLPDRAGRASLVPTGRPAKSPTLDYDEHIEVVRYTVERPLARAGDGCAAQTATAEQLELVGARATPGRRRCCWSRPIITSPAGGCLPPFCRGAKSNRVAHHPLFIPGRCVIEIALATVKRLRRAFPTSSASRIPARRPTASPSCARSWTRFIILVRRRFATLR